MYIEDFKAGTLVAQYQYSCFVPERVNLEWTWRTSALTTQLEQTIKSLSQLDALSNFVPDIGLFIRMHIVREASASSRIEGTQTEIEEAVLPEGAVLEERRDDWREVNNYVEAMKMAIKKLQELPLSIRLLREAHESLLSGVRGKNKLPGEIRRSQNWIGGSSIVTARFVPPAPEFLPDLLSDLEFFWHNERIEVPSLIRCAITHYQFETIHPFCDGNGRVGRLLIPFYLIDKGDLHNPALYVSDYFERNRESYYEALSQVRTNNDLLGWVMFFLRAIQETSDKGYTTFNKIFALRDEVTRYCEQKGTQGATLQRMFRELYSNPRVTINQLSELSGCDYQKAHRAVKLLCNDGWLETADADKRNSLYDFNKYLSLFKA